MEHQPANQINADQQASAEKKPWNTPRVITGSAEHTMGFPIVGVPDSRDPYGQPSLNAS